MNPQTKTFDIRTKAGTRQPHPFEEEFFLFGEWWVVHRRLYGIGYALSHKATGFRVPDSERGRAVESKYRGSLWLTEHEAQLPALLVKASR
jgi:hypothetical protein